MKILDFADILKNEVENSRAELIASHVKNRYIPLEEKQTRAKNIISVAYYVVDGESTILHINSVAKYMLTQMTLLDMYTDLERDTTQDGTMLKEFNALNELRFFDDLRKAIDEREFAEFGTILDMEADDVLQNEANAEAFVRNQVTRITDVMRSLIGPFLEQIVSQLDAESIASLKQILIDYVKGEIA